MFNFKQALRLCLVIGPSSVKGDWLAVVKQAIVGGATMVQLRDKNLDESAIERGALQLLSCVPPSIPLIINDHIAVAKKLGLGLHIGQKDGPCSYAREQLGSNAIIGLSIESKQQAIACRNSGADYFGIGPVFSTSSKPDAAKPLGIKQAINIAQFLQPLPSVFIGGVGVNNVVKLAGAADGIAVISAITNAPSPKCAAQQLLRKLEHDSMA